MTTKRKLLLLIGILVIVAAGVAAYAAWPRSAINPVNAAKIEVGMDLAAVEFLLGGPARDDSSGPVTESPPCNSWDDRQISREFFRGHGGPGEDQQAEPAVKWVSDTVTVFIFLDGNGQVEFCETVLVRRMRESPMAVVRRWLRL